MMVLHRGRGFSPDPAQRLRAARGRQRRGPDASLPMEKAALPAAPKEVADAAVFQLLAHASFLHQLRMRNPERERGGTQQFRHVLLNARLGKAVPVILKDKGL